jgi:hypothetical protein
VHGYFLADEEIRVLAEHFRSFDRVMVREGNNGHTPPLATGVDFGGVVIGLLAKPGQPGSVAHPRSSRMHMKVASHVSRVEMGYEQRIKAARIDRERLHGTH